MRVDERGQLKWKMEDYDGFKDGNKGINESIQKHTNHSKLLHKKNYIVTVKITDITLIKRPLNW